MPSGLGAAHGAGPRKARLDGLFGAPADWVQGAVAVLQSRTALGSVELNEGGYAVTWTLLTVPIDDRRAGIEVLVIRVMALRLSVALQDGFPADRTTAVVRRSDTYADDEDQYTADQNRCPLHQCGTTCHFQEE